MIEVFANGRKFSEWTDARVVRSLDHIAAAFSLTLVAGIRMAIVCVFSLEILSRWPSTGPR